jgi:hypothetical protein
MAVGTVHQVPRTMAWLALRGAQLMLGTIVQAES